MLHFFYAFILFWLVAFFCVYLLYWYDVINFPCQKLSTPAFSISKAAKLYVRFLAMHCLRPFLLPAWYFSRKKLFFSPLDPEADLQHPPVILIQGIIDMPATWLYCTKRLTADGYRATAFSYDSVRKDIYQVVKAFDEFMYLVEASFPDNPPVLVAHSLGGLVVREWFRSHPDTAKRARGLITIATPHQGSRVAHFAPGKAAPCLHPGCDFLSTLEKESIKPLPFPCTSIVSPTDEMVLPASSLLPPPSWKMIITGEISHLGLLFSPKVYTMVREEIALLENLPTAENTAERATAA